MYFVLLLNFFLLTGEPLIAATQDFITGAFLITQKDQFFNKSQFCQICSMLLAGKDSTMKIDIPPPAMIKVFVTLSCILRYFYCDHSDNDLTLTKFVFHYVFM